jgi:hypothetical protein
VEICGIPPIPSAKFHEDIEDMDMDMEKDMGEDDMDMKEDNMDMDEDMEKDMNEDVETCTRTWRYRRCNGDTDTWRNVDIDMDMDMDIRRLLSLL